MAMMHVAVVMASACAWTPSLPVHPVVTAPAGSWGSGHALGNDVYLGAFILCDLLAALQHVPEVATTKSL